MSSPTRGRPIAGAILTLDNGEPIPLTGGDGRFALSSLTAGAHSVKVSTSGYQEAQLSFSVPGGGVTLTLSSTLIPATGNISLQVLDAGAEPTQP